MQVLMRNINMSKILKFLFITSLTIILFVVLFACYVFYENSHIKITDYTIVSEKITAAEDGGKLAVIADYHNSDNYEMVLRKTKEIAPDVIIVAGDFINMEDKDFSNAEKLMRGLTDTAPVYFVSGNHERWLKSEENIFLNKMKNCGAVILNMDIAEVPIKNGKITITGYQDIIYADDDMREEYLNAQLEGMYSRLTKQQLNMFNILVFHRGNLLHNAARQNYDLIVSGHLHGGQINIPGIREKILKSKTGSDEFIKGYYEVDNSKAIISGGVGSNSKIMRVFNMPEVISITLRSND